MLTNLIYTGRFIFRSTPYIGKHEPLVTGATFNQVQKELKRDGKAEYQNRSLAFAGLIFCGHCSGAVTGDIKQKGRYIYYRCGHYKQKCPDKKSWWSSFLTTSSC